MHTSLLREQLSVRSKLASGRLNYTALFALHRNWCQGIQFTDRAGSDYSIFIEIIIYSCLAFTAKYDRTRETLLCDSDTPVCVRCIASQDFVMQYQSAYCLVLVTLRHQF